MPPLAMKVVPHPKIRRSDQTLAGVIAILSIVIVLLGLAACAAGLADRRNWTGDMSYGLGLLLLVSGGILLIGSISLRNGTPSGYGGWIAGGLLLGLLSFGLLLVLLSLGLVPGVVGGIITSLWFALAVLGSVRAIANR